MKLIVFAAISLFVHFVSAAAKSSIVLSEAASKLFEQHKEFQDALKRHLLKNEFSENAANLIAGIIPQIRINSAGPVGFSSTYEYTGGLFTIQLVKKDKADQLHVRFKVDDNQPNILSFAVTDIAIGGKYFSCDLTLVHIVEVTSTTRKNNDVHDIFFNLSQALKELQAELNQQKERTMKIEQLMDDEYKALMLPNDGNDQ